MDFTPALALADAVLYEGYLLYPYRRSSIKNRVRWQFGVLAPRTWIDGSPPVGDGVAGSAESWWNQTECLLEAPARARVALRLRFLQLTAADQAGALPPLDHAVAREIEATVLLSDLLDSSREVRVRMGESGHPGWSAGDDMQEAAVAGA